MEIQSLREALANGHRRQDVLARCARIRDEAHSFGCVWIVRAIWHLERLLCEQRGNDRLLTALWRCEEEFAIVGRMQARDLALQHWAKVREAVSVRRWILHWVEHCAQAAEERRIALADTGVLEVDALFVAQ